MFQKGSGARCGEAKAWAVREDARVLVRVRVVMAVDMAGIGHLALGKLRRVGGEHRIADAQPSQDADRHDPMASSR